MKSTYITSHLNLYIGKGGFIVKNHLIGLLLAFQFFTSVPIRKQLPVNQSTVTAMYTMMPFVSLFMGCTMILLILLNTNFFQFSSLLLAILIVVANIMMTGGLHLDGWIDMGDAYFSYQDRKRRLEILEDPRVGAFGAISLVVLLVLKIGFIFEVLNHQLFDDNLIFFLLIPVFSRIALLIYFTRTANVKDNGLAAYFKTQVIHKNVQFSIILYSIAVILFAFYFESILIFFLYIFMLVFVLLYRKWTIQQFGGMTGDLLGALYEGTELFLWGMLLLFI